MDNKHQNLTKQMVIYLFLVVLVLPSTGLARRSRRDGSERETRTNEKDVRKEQKQQEATQSFPEVSGALTAILEEVAKNQRPQPAAIERVRQLLEENKHNGRAYDDSQKAQYMLLQAWAGFCQDDPVEAVNWSMRAAKTDATNGDAWISQGLFCMLNGKRPMEPRVKKSRKPRRRNDLSYGNRGRSRRGRDEEALAEAPAESTEPYGRQGVLEFDMSALRKDMFKRRFTRHKYQTVEGEEIEYEPRRDTLCILFWQSGEMVVDANDVNGGDESRRSDEDFGMMDFGTASQNQNKHKLENQRKYMEQIAEACKDNEQVKFIQINTDTSVVAKQSSRGDAEGAIPMVVVAESGSGAEGYRGLRAAVPFMLIVDKEGEVKYAGPAADFMPAFILTELTGVEIDLEKQEQPAALSQMDRSMMHEEMMEFDPMFMAPMPMERPAKTLELFVDPNRVANDPNGVAGATVQRILQAKKPDFPKGPAKPAALLRGLTWIKGKPVKFQLNNVYVVEFWATWCPPCKESIPHLTEIQHKYKDKGVTVIGITNEAKLGEIKKFVAEQGDKMDYTVAVDKSGKTNAAYMKSYRQNGIPTAFVVDGAGQVVWYGHPMAGLDAVVEYLITQASDTDDVTMSSPNASAKPEQPVKPSPVAKRPSDFPTQSLENELRAEKLLQLAKMDINLSKKRLGNPKDGIEAARQVLKEFPNTEHARQARELLRRVPSRWQKRNNITDEELGL